MKKYIRAIIKIDESILRSIGRFTVDNFGGRSIKIEYMDGGYNLTDYTDEAYKHIRASLLLERVTTIC